ncbi:MAG TPA: threonine ammonia-lyase [Microbacteriaceae bacterium]|nr:threonine ammonia-lyase [Microbacteriaceae bacterium]
MSEPTFDELVTARQNVSAVARVTPVESSGYLAGILGAPVVLKCENLQRTGAYKIRGAYNRLSQLTAEERARGVVAASAGNHAQGVSYAARELGIQATIFMPIGVALPKLEATRDYGANVQLTGEIFADTLVAAKAFAAETGAVFIPPFDHPDVVAGQASVGFEILEQVPNVDTVVVPIGGGGLISGVAAAVKQQAARLGRSVRVVGVQAANAAPYPASLAAGHIQSVPPVTTIADGIAVYTPGSLNFDMVQRYVDDVVTVSEDDFARALVVLLERAKLVVEPAGAASVAAILSGALAAAVPNPGTTVAILSGGNIDPLLMQRVIAVGLAASARYLTIKVSLPDRPGQLALVAETLTAVSANVVEVLHTRHSQDMRISEVELQVSVETRGPEHRELVIQALREAGLDPRVVD